MKNKTRVDFKEKLIMEDLLIELYLLREIEILGKLTEAQSERYLEIVEMCKKNDIKIPFDIVMVHDR